MTFQEAYKLPLKQMFSKVFAESGAMAFDFMHPFMAGMFKRQIMELTEYEEAEVIKKLNGEPSDFYFENVTYEEDGAICVDGFAIMLIRGWGFLTGIGGLNLDPETAIKIQNDFANWVVETLSKKDEENS